MKGPLMSEKEDMTEPELEEVGVGLGVVPFSAVFRGSRAVRLPYSYS